MACFYKSCVQELSRSAVFSPSNTEISSIVLCAWTFVLPHAVTGEAGRKTSYEPGSAQAFYIGKIQVGGDLSKTGSFIPID